MISTADYAGRVRIRLCSSVSAAIIVGALLLLSPASVFGIPTYTGYSGAPGTAGTCAYTCHGTTGGTIIVVGFPTTYQPGDTYVVHVGHDSAGVIVNFNASVRIGAGPGIAGSLLAGLNTAVYDAAPSESVGVYFSTIDVDSGTFSWVAPSPGGGDVKLYLAGLQVHYGGPNTQIVVTAAQSPTGANEQKSSPASGPSLVLLNRVVTDYLVLRANVPPGSTTTLRVLDAIGRTVSSISLAPGASPQTILWTPVDQNSRRLAPGSYYANLSAGKRRLTAKFVVIE